jgi:hypothetical protein
VAVGIDRGEVHDQEKDDPEGEEDGDDEEEFGAGFELGGVGNGSRGRGVGDGARGCSGRVGTSVAISVAFTHDLEGMR